MILKRETAEKAITSGTASLSGMTYEMRGNDNGYWIITNHAFARTDHVKIIDDDPWELDKEKPNE